LDEGTKEYFCVQFVNPNTDQLPCFARLQDMQSLKEKLKSQSYFSRKNSNHTCTFVLPVPSSFSQGRAKFSGWAKQRRGRYLSPVWRHKGEIQDQSIRDLIFSQAEKDSQNSEVKTLTENSRQKGTKYRLGELILMLKNLRKW